MKFAIEVRAGSTVRLKGTSAWHVFPADGEYVVEITTLWEEKEVDA